jgi:hypothetical protein
MTHAPDLSGMPDRPQETDSAAKRTLPYCSVCGMPKKPIGRDVGAAAANGYCDHECPGYMADPKPGYLWPGETPEEPVNVKVARALGLKREYRERLRVHVWVNNDGIRYMEPLPNFPNNPEFCWRIVEANGLSVEKIQDTDENGHECEIWIVGKPYADENGDGANPRAAVCSWLVAAHAAGVEIKR